MHPGILKRGFIFPTYFCPLQAKVLCSVPNSKLIYPQAKSFLSPSPRMNLPPLTIKWLSSTFCKHRDNIASKNTTISSSSRDIFDNCVWMWNEQNKYPWRLVYCLSNTYVTRSREMSHLSKIPIPIFLHTFSKLQNASFWCKSHYNWASGYRVMKDLPMIKTI